ncbi:MAG: hypothetical protein WH035_05640, partial [Spirochaetota bacterium]
LVSCQGPVGPEGPIGPVGPTGPTGSDGEDGEDGTIKILFYENQDAIDLAYSSDTIVIITSSYVVLSNDGIYWYGSQNNPFVNYLNAVAYGNGVFIVVNECGDIYRSIDSGNNWNKVRDGDSVPLKSVAYGNGIFIAVGGDSSNSLILRSTDNGLTWSNIDNSIDPPANKRISYANNKFFITKNDIYDNCRIYISEDGIDWIQPEAGVNQNGAELYKVCYGNGVYMVADSYGYIYYSLSGDGWEILYPALPDISGCSCNGFTYGKNSFVALIYYSINNEYKLHFPYNQYGWLFPAITLLKGDFIHYTSIYYISWLNEGTYLIFYYIINP